jgi:hypothetical protein
MPALRSVARRCVSNRLCRSIVCLLDSLQPFRGLYYGLVSRVIAQLQTVAGTARQTYFPHSVNSRRSLDGVICIHFMDTGKPFPRLNLSSPPWYAVRQQAGWSCHPPGIGNLRGRDGGFLCVIFHFLFGCLVG